MVFFLFDKVLHIELIIFLKEEFEVVNKTAKYIIFYFICQLFGCYRKRRKSKNVTVGIAGINDFIV